VGIRVRVRVRVRVRPASASKEASWLRSVPVEWPRPLKAS